MKVQTSIVVLAAAQRQRPRAEVRSAESLRREAAVLRLTLGNAIQTRLPVVVVTTAALAPLVADQIARRDTVVISDNEVQRGAGHIIATGVAACASASGWLLLPGDMPLVQPQTLLAVAAALQQYPVAYAQYHGRHGHPVGFAAELYSELVTLAGDEGARRLVARYPAFAAELDDPGVLVDVQDVAELPAAASAASASAARALP